MKMIQITDTKKQKLSSIAEGILSMAEQLLEDMEEMEEMEVEEREAGRYGRVHEEEPAVYRSRYAMRRR